MGHDASEWQSQHINPKTLRSYLQYNEPYQLLKQLRTYFESLTPQRIEAAREAAQNGDSNKLKQSLHALKNSFLNVGAESLADFCQKTEDEVLATSSTHQLDCLTYIEKSFLESLSEIQSIMEQIEKEQIKID